MNSQCAITAEECILLNINHVLFFAFNLPKVQELTNGRCTFNGISTWEDLAALMSGFPAIDWKWFLDVGGIIAVMQSVVDRQATAVEQESCEWQSQKTYFNFLPTLRTKPRPLVFADLQKARNRVLFNAKPTGTTSGINHCRDMNQALQTRASTWSMDVPEQTAALVAAAASSTQGVLPTKGSTCKMWAGMIKELIGGVPAITCDCNALVQPPPAPEMKCRNPGQGQAYLNSLMSSATGLPFKMGTPLMFGCA